MRFHGFQEYRENSPMSISASLIILDNKHFWPRQRESISTKTTMGLKQQTFSPANLSTSIVIVSCEYCVWLF